MRSFSSHIICPHCEETIACASLEDRFSLYVDKHGPIPSNILCVGNCWIWCGNTRRGRGCIGVGKNKNKSAPRVSWEMKYGDIPEGMCVCHQCDNPLCVRPEHLFLGTQAENVADKVAKGRQGRGEKARSAVFSDNDVRSIRLEYIPKKMGYKRLAKKYGVQPATIRNIIIGKTWKHLL